MKGKLKKEKEKENEMVKEKVIKSGNVNKNESEIGYDGGEKIAEKSNEKDTVENTENSDNKLNQKNSQNGENDDENVFQFFWPFFFTQDESDNATNYLSAINNSHIITQLIANYKILMLANERGLTINDQNLISEIGNIVIPTMGTENDGFEYYGKKEQFSPSVSTSMERTDENSEYENDSEEEIIYTKKTNKRRVANNKRRKQNKKNRIEDRENRREKKNNNDSYNNMDDCNEMKDRKITFSTDNNSSIMIDSNDDSENEINGNKIGNDTLENGVTDNENTLKNTDSNNNNIAHTLTDDNENKKQNSDVFNFREKGKFPVLRIRDLALLDEKKKTIRVHEYYKNWKIYDLDVVY